MSSTFLPESVCLFEHRLHNELHAVVFKNRKDVLTIYAALSDDQRHRFVCNEIRSLNEPSCFLEAAEVLKVVLPDPISSFNIRRMALELLQDLQQSQYDQVRRVTFDVISFTKL
ncbi:hypothetical protein GEMRC1_012121 [Eukaryota sp. GEM-RC1]